mgnify:CR=1 FL=1
MQFLLALWLSFLVSFAQNPDSLEQKAKKLKDEDPDKFKLYIKLARHYQEDAPEKSLVYLRRAAGLTQNPESLAVAVGMISKGFLAAGNYDSSLHYSFIAEKLIVENRLDHYFSTLYLNRAYVYRNRFQLSDAFDHFVLARDWSVKTNNPANKVSSLAGLASIYSEQKRYNNAIELFMQAKDTAEKYSQFGLLFNVRNNLANLFGDMKRFNEALVLYKENLVFAQNVDDPNNTAGTWLNIAAIYQELNKLRDAGAAYDSALKYTDHASDPRLKENIFRTVGEWHIFNKNYERGLEYSMAALGISQKMGLLSTQKFIYRNMAEAYHSLGQYQKSYECFEKFAELADSLAKSKYDESLAEAQVHFDSERQQMKIERQEQEIRFQRYALAGGLLLLALAIVLLLIVAQRNRYRKIVSQKLEEQNRQILQANDELKLKGEEIRQQNEEIRQQSEALAHQRDKLALSVHRLNELADFKEKMTAMVVHDLKNPLSSIIAFAESPGGKDKLDDIAAAGRQMLTLTLNMLDIQKFKDAKMQLECAAYSSGDLIAAAIRQVAAALEKKNIAVDTQIDFMAGVWADREIIVRTLVNLLTNAAKFSPPSSRIVVSSERSDDNRVRFEVKDSGLGIPEDKLSDVFWQYDKADAKAYAGTGSTGLGLTFCRLAVQSHGGQIGVNSIYGNGATFYFTLPYAKVDGKGDIQPLKSSRIFEFSDLSPAEKFKLRPFLTRLFQFNVYETSALLNVLSDVPSDGEKIEEWKKAVTMAVFSCDEVRFDALIRRPALSSDLD